MAACAALTKKHRRQCNNKNTQPSDQRCSQFPLLQLLKLLQLLLAHSLCAASCSSSFSIVGVPDGDGG
jgi:hypothetical protein